MRIPWVVLLVALGGAASADTLAGHTVVLDSGGKILSWLPQERAYAEVSRLAWNFIENQVPSDARGLKIYLTHSMFDQNTLMGIDPATDSLHAPAGLYAMFVDSVVRWFPYSGDAAAVTAVRGMLDYQLAHGMTPATNDWASIPYSTSNPAAAEYTGALCCEGNYYLEPDKAGELGYGFLQMYELVGDVRYRDAAVGIATTLASHMRVGDATHSPLPFRVFAETGYVAAEYSANLAGTLMLLDELVRLGLGDVAAYRTARARAWSWILAYPMQNQLWSIVFEDIASSVTPAEDPTQYIPQKLEIYLLEHPEVDPDWRTDLAPILPWVEANFAIDTATEHGLQYGANVISEQKTYMFKMGNHSGRYAAASALWAERTGDASARDKAFRSFNWATYMASPDGLVVFGPAYYQIVSGYWFQTGYGDYIRQFMTGMGANPAWAPPGESHVLRSSSVVQRVSYGPSQVSYTSFAADSIEVLRLAFRPTRVTAGGSVLALASDLVGAGYTLEDLGGGDVALRVHHVASGEVVVANLPGDDAGVGDAGDAGAIDAGALDARVADGAAVDGRAADGAAADAGGQGGGGGGCGCAASGPAPGGWTAGALGLALVLVGLLRRRRAH